MSPVVGTKPLKGSETFGSPAQGLLDPIAPNGARIAPAGEIQTDALGFKGSDCEHATPFSGGSAGCGRAEDQEARIQSTQYQNQSAEDWRAKSAGAQVRNTWASVAHSSSSCGKSLTIGDKST